MKTCTNCGTELPDEARFCGKCGTKQPDIAVQGTTTSPSTQPNEASAQHINVNIQQSTPRMIIQTPKSMGIAILLTFFFGPLGLLYATITGGVIMIILGIIVGIVTLGLGEVIIWPISIIWSAVAVKKYNENLMNNIMQND